LATGQPAATLVDSVKPPFFLFLHTWNEREMASEDASEDAIETPLAGDVTRLLRRWKAGDREAVGELVPLVYLELRELAGRYLRRERVDHTLPPTALVHEAYMRLVGSDPSNATIANRRHFFAVAAQAMRRILVEHARRHAAARRPSPRDAVGYEEAGPADLRTPEPLHEVLVVHEALDRLRSDHPRQTQVVELRYFGGLGEEEVAEVIGVSRATVARDWRVARLLLGRFLRQEAAG
jgi:RNA polymerase sigma factor (TIGR02999 family)